MFDAPEFSLDVKGEDFYTYTADDFILNDYIYGPKIKSIPVAV